jgi:hypothetical protein
MSKLLFVVAFSLLLLTACDPNRLITMTNKTPEKTTVVWTLKKDSAKLSPLFMNNSTEVVYDLKPENPHNKASLAVGIGRWTHAELQDLCDDLESLEIKSGNSQQKIISENEMHDYLWQRTKGLTKRKIVLVFN